jgi:hypothetical protein
MKEEKTLEKGEWTVASRRCLELLFVSHDTAAHILPDRHYNPPPISLLEPLCSR